uniref:Uncharacterized protein n=1 Tax=Chlamydomonas leiostraca TaxID=1034604 RepID=A0A7S0S5C4_9CHLO|mmetsp:Transcript_7806/g.19415  ORF Transcript_7806/g.19415 Transcript_7806/m.19415 type:complete len:307 (+) Transcript_7806:3-923(+)
MTEDVEGGEGYEQRTPGPTPPPPTPPHLLPGAPSQQQQQHGHPPALPPPLQQVPASGMASCMSVTMENADLAKSPEHAGCTCMDVDAPREEPAGSGAGGAGAGTAQAGGRQGRGRSSDGGGARAAGGAGQAGRAAAQSFHEIKDASQALAALEAQLSGIVNAADTESMDRLRELLEREVEEHAAAAQREWELRAARAAAEAAAGAPRRGRARRRGHHSGLKPDPGNTEDPSAIGEARVPHHRDSEQAGLEPEAHLRAGRHGEWAPTSLARDRRATASWGVSLAPPGQEEATMTPGALEAIRAQHAR